MHQTFQTPELAAPPDRFDLWQSMIANAAMPVRARSPYANDFAATMRVDCLGPVTFFTLDHPSLQVERTRAHIRQADPESLVVVLNLAGRQRVDQNRRTALLSPGDLTLYHSSWPMSTLSDPTIQRESAVVVTMPQAEVSPPIDRLRSLLATRLRGDSGVGRIVSAYLRAMATSGALADTAGVSRLGHITLDLISVMLGRLTDEIHSVAPESRQRAAMARIELFILSNLRDPSLTPETIAAAHHLSVRSLYRLFQAHRTGVAGWIRDRRLERCQRALSDPALASLSVAAVARRWGFVDAAHFSRVFKQAYGCSPTQYRNGAPDRS